MLIAIMTAASQCNLFCKLGSWKYSHRIKKFIGNKNIITSVYRMQA